jgi:hypothetical protein
MAQPRIGRPDRLAALGAPIGPLAGPGPIARFLRDSQQARRAPGPSGTALPTSA